MRRLKTTKRFERDLKRTKKRGKQGSRFGDRERANLGGYVESRWSARASRGEVGSMSFSVANDESDALATRTFCSKRGLKK